MIDCLDYLKRNLILGFGLLSQFLQLLSNGEASGETEARGREKKGIGAA
jgi:hypothetical protein